MKKALMIAAIATVLTLPALALASGWGGWWKKGHGHQHDGGGGVPEPITLALIAAGGGLALGARKIIKKDK